MSEAELEALEWGGLLHDIGKIGIPDAILLKQGELDKEERMVMNAHPVKGEEIIRPVQKLAPELPIIRHHHEWFNGSGYPDRLVGHDIPRLARIMHVADSFEAMTAARPYRMTPLSEEQALGELHKYSGIQFDPEVVAAFDRLIAQRPAWVAPNIPKHLTERPIPRLGENVKATAGLGSARDESSPPAGTTSSASRANTHSFGLTPRPSDATLGRCVGPPLPTAAKS